MAQRERLDELTAREREVLDLVRLGLTNEEIAGRLGITEAGAKYHVSQILSKLGVASRGEAAALAHPYVAEAFQPRRGRWWAALPLAARAAGAAVVLAAVAGLGLLAWGVLETANEGESGLVDAPTATESETGTITIYGTVVAVDWNALTMKIRALGPDAGEFDAKITITSLIQLRGTVTGDTTELRPRVGEVVLATLRLPGPPYEIDNLLLDPEVFTVEGAGMAPTLANSVTVGVTPYGEALPERGDIVVFTSPTAPTRSFVKRVMGTPGDSVEIADGQLSVNRQPVHEPYVVGSTQCTPPASSATPSTGAGSGITDTCAWDIPDVGTESLKHCGSLRCYFVLGDNRQNSSDSRQGWLVPLENIHGWVEAPSPSPTP